MKPVDTSSTVTVDGAEERARSDASGFEPRFEGGDRTGRGMASARNRDLSPPSLLIGLRAAQGEDGSLIDPGHIFEVERGEFRPPETTAEAGQQKSAVAAP